MLSQRSKPWFAPKRYGYGAGLPIAWQGWAMIALFALAMTFAHTLHNHMGRIATILSATVVLTIVAARKTAGGWRWRWGQHD